MFSFTERKEANTKDIETKRARERERSRCLHILHMYTVMHACMYVRMYACMKVSRSK